MSEYACWTGEEQEQNTESNLLTNSSKLSTQHNLQKIINKSDSAVLNRYHLDISMVRSGNRLTVVSQQHNKSSI